MGGAFGQDFTPSGFESTHGLDVLNEEIGGVGAGIPGSIVFRAEQGVDDPEVEDAMANLFATVQTIAANPIPIVLLVRDHAVIPRVAVAQSTSQIDWKDIELLVYSSDGRPASGLFALPEGPLRALRLSAKEGRFTLDLDPLAGTVKYRIEPR